VEALGVLFVLALAATPFVALGLALSARKRAKALEESVAAVRAEQARLEDRLLELRRELRLATEQTASMPVPEPAPSRREAPEAAPQPAPPPRPTPAPPIVRPAAPPSAPPTAVPPMPRPGSGLPPPIPLGTPARPVPPAAASVPPPIPQAARAVSPPIASAPAPAPLAPPPAPPKVSFDWESLVGVKLFSWVAGISLVVGAVLFLRYSVEKGWLGAPVRMAIGLATGIALLALCEMKRARGYRITANALDGAGIAILFSTFFASHALWKLIPSLAAFLFMALVTAVAVLLSIRRESVFIALLGLLGGFATPALLSTGEDRPVGLFGYLLLLNAGLAWVAQKKRWPVLTVLATVLTALYQWAWVVKFLSASKLPLALGIFAVFPILAFAALAIGRSEREPEGGGALALFEKTATASAVLPLFFAAYLAAVPAYGARWPLLFGFLLLLDAALFAIALWRGPVELHLVGGGATIVVAAVWLGVSYTGTAWPGCLAFFALLVLFYLGAPLLATKLGRPLTDPSDRAVFAAPLLLFVFPLLAHLEPRTESPALLFAVLFALLAAIAAYAIVRREGGVYFAGAFLALAAEAVWSSRYLTPERLLPALAIYGVFSLFYLGVPLAARRLGRALRPEGSVPALLLASLALLLFLAAGPAAQAALWGLALLLAVLNAGLFVEGSAARFPKLTIVGTVVSWLVIATWWATATVATLLVPALVVVAGFTMLTLGGSLWARGRLEAERAETKAGVFDGGLALGLAGHLFLLFVAAQPSLAVPAWPLLGVLGVLDLAVGAAALASRRGAIHAGSLVGSGVVLVTLAATARQAQWPRVEVLAAGAVAVFALAFAALARRRIGSAAAGLAPFDLGAAASLFFAQLVALVAASGDVRLGLGFLVAAHAAFVVGLLAIAWTTERHVLAVLGVVLSFAGVFLFSNEVPQPAPVERLLFGGALYLLFLAYPLALGARAKSSSEPYLAPILASVPFFFLARPALLASGLEGAIGLLPVTQAALLALLLVRLLRLEPPGGRTLGRLALVAGAVLAFVTVAIPLQLDKEWITIGWALEGAALAWLFTRVPHRGLLAWSAGLLIAVFVRLALNREVLAYHPRGGTPILNWYLYTYLVAAACFFAAARFLRTTRGDVLTGGLRVSAALTAGGAVLLFLVLNIEIADFYATGPALTFNFTGSSLAQDMTYTLGWALFAIGLLVAGVLAKNRQTRVASIVLLAVTALKAFLHDLGRLGGLYRVASLVGLAISLALVALAIQKFVLKKAERV
jgi:uncharacterized membrane protein